MFLSLETLTSILRTGLPILVELIDHVELYYNFSIWSDLNQMVNAPTRIPDWHSVSPALLDLSIFSDIIICSTMAFHPLGNSDHVILSVSIDFPSYSEWVALFHHIVCDYSGADWNGLHDHLRDVPWEDIFTLSVSDVEWVQVETDVYIPYWKYIRSSLAHLHGLQLLVLLP